VIIARVGRLAGQHDLEQNAQRPNVVALVLLLVGEDFGRHVEGGAYDARCDVHALGAEPEVDQLEFGVAQVLEHDILSLDVAVHDAHRVAVQDALHSLLELASGYFLRQTA